MARKLMSQSQYAKERGLSQQYVSQLVAKGVIPGHGHRRWIDPEEADAARERSIVPRMRLT